MRELIVGIGWALIATERAVAAVPADISPDGPFRRTAVFADREWCKQYPSVAKRSTEWWRLFDEAERVLRPTGGP